nr:ATP-binding protein [uncultured Bacteroides sp.]
MGNSHLSLVTELIDNNLGYSLKVSPNDIIEWENEIVSVFQKEKDYKRMFIMKQMAVYAYGFQSQITEALKKANAMMTEAKSMNYDIGIALSHFALGDTYLHASMTPEAVEEYENAIKILYKIPQSEKLQERVFTQLIPTLIKLKRMNEAETYLESMGRLYTSNQLNPFIHYIYQAYYCLRIGDLSKARKYIIDAEKANNENPFYFHSSILKYMQAEYAKETGNYDKAIRLYTSLAENTNSINVYNNYLKLRKSIAKIYKELGHYKEACETYQAMNATRDSINAHNYTSQINLLRTVYQVDRLGVENQNQRNRLLFYLIIGGILILTVFMVFVIYIRQVNKRLATSRQKLNEARKNAENSMRTKSLFLSNMSHEIRTPLNALSGFSSILIDNNIDKDIRQQCNDIIQQNSDLLLKLIDDVVDLSSLERGKMQFHFGVYDAVSLCRNVIDTVEKIKQTSAAVTFQTSMEKLELYTDEARLQQLLINLLINATKFTTQGIITLMLEVDSDGMAQFSVTDTGCGIAPEKQDKIFNRFEKLDENAQGSGLGLSICQLIVEHFGGKIWIDKEYKDGARFVFTHPIHSNEKREETIS